MNDDGVGQPRQRPRVLLLYYSFTGQSQKVLEAAGEAFSAAGCEVREARIQFTDPRYAKRFERFPMRRVWPDMLSVLPAQLRRACGEIQVPSDLFDENYDLVCIGSPTWWSTTSMPVRSFLRSAPGAKLLADRRFAVFVVCRRYWRGNARAVRRLSANCGGEYVDEIHFTYLGGQLRSMLSLTSYLGSGRYRTRYFGVPMPPTNVQPEQLAQARDFATSLAGRIRHDEVV